MKVQHEGRCGQVETFEAAFHAGSPGVEHGADGAVPNENSLRNDFHDSHDTTSSLFMVFLPRTG